MSYYHFLLYSEYINIIFYDKLSTKSYFGKSFIKMDPKYIECLLIFIQYTALPNNMFEGWFKISKNLYT